MATREAARQAVARISEKFGHLDEHELDRLEQFDPDLRRKVEQSLLAKDKIAGHAIITLAHNLYGSDARFVFELLQNADDNSYTRAQARENPPYVSFGVYKDRIVVECNEDGFTERDLQAICAVGQSSKSASHGYIGAKGIGFKSVFIAAWKVHVQSGHFSFCFKHKKGDSGLGMAIPIWQETEEILEDPLTRMTLYLHDTGGEAHLIHLRQTIIKQLSDLQETSLLFLKNLESISVRFYDEDGAQTSSRVFHRENVDTHRVELRVTSGPPNELAMESKWYHVTRHMGTNLSRSVSRDIPDSDVARNAASRAEVVLAFPLTENEEPILKNQDLFAFLPLRESEFKFIIQSDFDTSANRQDIVTTSQRNVDLLDAIAETFMKAILEFCEHPDLCYTWPRFLPSSKDGITAFWSRLRDKIKHRVSESAVLLPRHGTRLRKIGTVFKLTTDFMDDTGEPLLDDSGENVFLSKRYQPASITALREYGLQLNNLNIVYRLLHADLEQENSRMKSPSTTQYWHSTMAKLLQKAHPSFRSHAFLPLGSGAWVAPANGPVYLPTTSGISVPLGIDLRILDSTAVANNDRKIMFTTYGATEPTVPSVRSSILRAYDTPRNVDAAQSKAHLQFLYSSHLLQPRPTREDYRRIYLFTSLGHAKAPREEDIFLSTDSPYGASELLKSQEGVPVLHVSYLHPDYLLQPPDSPSAQHPTWSRWLHDFIGVREHLRLVARSGNTLSDAWTHVATHKPDKLLGLLEHLWKREGTQVKNSPVLKSQIRDTKLDGLCISPRFRSLPLSEGFIPLDPLKHICERYMDRTEDFPFLKLDSGLTSEQLRTKWRFLHEDLSIGLEIDVSFLTRILFWLKQEHENGPKPAHHAKLVNLYIALHAKFLESAQQEDDKQRIKLIVNSNECLFVPPSVGDAGDWVSSSACLWDGPSDLYTKTSLKAIYSRSFGPDRTDQVSRFFRSTLQIPDATVQDIIAELQYMKAEEDSIEFDRVSMLYEWLSAKVIASPGLQRLVKHSFDQHELIFVSKDENAAWYKASDCIWSSTTDIRGKATLNEDYEDLEDFFINVLSVRRLTLKMVYDELLQTDARTSTAEIKGTIWSLNALLQTTTETVDPAPMLGKNIFPVSYPNGTTTLSNAIIDFSIGDRDYLIAHFKDKIKMLDFDLTEIRQLTPFLSWANLTHRYLSRSVREITSVSPEDAQPIPSPIRDLKLRAHAILRIAASFASPRYADTGPAFYEVLRTMKTLTTDRISSVLKLVQDGISIDVETQAGDMHIGELDSSVTIYVPRNKRKQNFCFASPLPANLADWLMRDGVTNIPKSVDEAMVTALTTLLNTAPAVTTLVLDRQGIAQVPEVNEDPESYDDTQEEEEEEGGNDGGALQSTEVHDESSTALVRQSTNAQGGSPMIGQMVLEVTTRRSRLEYDRHVGGNLPHLVPLRNESNGNAGQYRELLNKVVRAARGARFPSRGAFDMSALRAALWDGTATSYNGFESRMSISDNNFERNFLVGAAGELYVFEMLSRLSPALYGWNRDNWQSNIRGRVAVHEDYGDLRAWGQPETSDLVYDDTRGEFTALLITHGYLEAAAWEHARPFYHIEVKTTTAACGTAFYMSKNQYQMMTRIHNGNETGHRAGQQTIYMIFRVFELGDEGRMGMRIYLDPEQLKLDGDLVFTGESWSIVPGSV